MRLHELQQVQSHCYERLSKVIQTIVQFEASVALDSTNSVLEAVRLMQRTLELCPLRTVHCGVSVECRSSRKALELTKQHHRRHQTTAYHNVTCN